MFFCLQRNLKVSTLKPIQSPWHPERSPHITDLVLRKTRWLLVSVSDPSPLGEISRSSWKKTGKRKVLTKAIWKFDNFVEVLSRTVNQQNIRDKNILALEKSQVFLLCITGFLERFNIFCVFVNCVWHRAWYLRDRLARGIGIHPYAHAQHIDFFHLWN